MNVGFARVLAAALAVVGAWYAARGLWMLLTLPATTNAWIVASRDPDFQWDYGLFAPPIAMGAFFMTGLRHLLAIVAWFVAICGAYGAVWIIARISERRDIVRVLRTT